MNPSKEAEETYPTPIYFHLMISTETEHSEETINATLRQNFIVRVDKYLLYFYVKRINV